MATFRSRGRTPRGAALLDHRADACTGLHQDQRLTHQLVQLDGAAGEAVAGRYGQHHAVAQERLVGEGAVRSGGADHAQLELAGQHPVDHC
jgi:hypothetical protein